MALFRFDEHGEITALSSAGRALLKIFGADRLRRFDAWVESLGAVDVPPDVDRCPWAAPFSGRCIKHTGHAELCWTVFYIDGEAHYKRWYGINYNVTAEGSDHLW